MPGPSPPGLITLPLSFPPAPDRHPTHGDAGAAVLGGGDIGGLDGDHHCVHQVLGRLDQRGGAVQAGNDQLTTDVLHVRLHLRGRDRRV